jgi:hypothetical protein
LRGFSPQEIFYYSEDFYYNNSYKVGFANLSMNKYLKSRLDSKLLELAGHLAGICKRKKIEVADRDTFVLNSRKLIFDYHTLTGDYKCLVKHLLLGKATLNEIQMGNYQSRDLARACGEFSLEGFLYTDVD